MIDVAPRMRAARSITSRDAMFTLMDGYRCSPARAIEKHPSPSSKPASHAISHDDVQTHCSVGSDRIAEAVSGLGVMIVSRPRVVALYQELKWRLHSPRVCAGATHLATAQRMPA